MKDANKSVLITGSSRGLGEKLALIFADKGYDIILHGRNKKNLDRVKEKIIEKKVSCYILGGDLKSDKTITRLAMITQKKDISVLINNAALGCPHLPLDKINDEQIDDMLKTNLIAPIKLTKKIYSFFARRGYGAIININSISGLENQRLRSIYCASKWGLRGFTESLKLEAGKHNIRIIDIYPSRIKTRPDFTYGMEAIDAAKKIFGVYKEASSNKIIMDNRPKKAKAK